MSNKFNRFKDASWFPKDGEEIYTIVGGAGGIGRYICISHF